MSESISVKGDVVSGDFVDYASKTIREYIVENFMFGDSEGLDEVTSFQDSGIIDSTGILELVTFLEERFSIAIADEELVPQNLDSIRNVVRFLNNKCPTAGLSM
jgi:acyl carrier protein